MTITVDDMVCREVYYNVSCLVDDLMQLTCNGTGSSVSVSYEDLLEICSKDHYDDVVDDYIARVMNRPDLIEHLDAAGVIDEHPDSDGYGWTQTSDQNLASILFNYLKDNDKLREFADDRSLEPDRLEAYEHWLVSDWLADRLEEKGEMIGRDICGLIVWGRCTSGQMISMDHVIQEIWKELVS